MPEQNVANAEDHTIALAQWQAEMSARGRLDCKFVCPACGNIASPNDWKALGADHQRSPQECIGRLRLEGASIPGSCDYAAFGFIDLCPVHIEMPDGKRIAVFAFAP